MEVNWMYILLDGFKALQTFNGFHAKVNTWEYLVFPDCISLSRQVTWETLKARLFYY